MSTSAVRRKTAIFDQACAVSFRRKSGRIQFCVITSSTGRWLFPKGVVDAGGSYAETALKEALEEAGLHGRIVGEPLGSYEIVKSGKRLSVLALPMEVHRADKVWEEAETRERQWVSPRRAQNLLSGSRLFELLDEAIRRLSSSD